MGAAEYFLVLIFLVLLAVGWWVPTFVALWRRRHGYQPNLAQVVLIDGFVGWTVIGWIVALLLAFKTQPDAPGGYPYQQPGGYPYQQWPAAPRGQARGPQARRSGTSGWAS